MTDHPIPPRASTNPRDEKLLAIASVFGDAVAARLAKAPPAQPQRRPDGPATTADRVAWQTNRLIAHLRARVGPDEGRTPPTRSAPAMPRPPIQPRKAAQIPVLVEGEDLAAEHPAVIAHMLREAPQHMRVAVLRALPGQVARAVMRRLRVA